MINQKSSKEDKRNSNRLGAFNFYDKSLIRNQTMSNLFNYFKFNYLSLLKLLIVSKASKTGQSGKVLTRMSRDWNNVSSLFFHKSMHNVYVTFMFTLGRHELDQ